MTNTEIQSLWKGSSEGLLKSLHILTRDGKLNADSRRKLKQVQHLVQLITPFLIKTLEKRAKLHVVDVGAGKSYLGFLLYDLFLKNHHEASLTSIETRDELVSKSEALARESSFDRMKFICSPIESANPPDSVDFVCALHACDTATDDAILFGISKSAFGFALVPCCQAEVARSLDAINRGHSGEDSLHSLHEFPIHRREFGSHLTNVIRTLLLKSHGYRVTVTELVGWEHSLKNELILAEKVSDEGHPESLRAKEELNVLLKRFPVKMKLLGS